MEAMLSLIGQAWIRVRIKTSRWWDKWVPDAIQDLIFVFALFHALILMIFYFYWFITWIAGE